MSDTALVYICNTCHGWLAFCTLNLGLRRQIERDTAKDSSGTLRVRTIEQAQKIQPCREVSTGVPCAKAESPR